MNVANRLRMRRPAGQIEDANNGGDQQKCPHRISPFNRLERGSFPDISSEDREGTPAQCRATATNTAAAIGREGKAP
jgi:hypothetical protein